MSWLLTRLICWFVEHDDSREFVRDDHHHMIVRCRCQRCDRITEGLVM